jgi:hypothetical protein
VTPFFFSSLLTHSRLQSFVSSSFRSPYTEYRALIKGSEVNRQKSVWKNFLHSQEYINFAWTPSVTFLDGLTKSFSLSFFFSAVNTVIGILDGIS